MDGEGDGVVGGTECCCGGFVGGPASSRRTCVRALEFEVSRHMLVVVWQPRKE